MNQNQAVKFLYTLIICLFISACDTQNNDSTDEEDILPDSVNMEGMAMSQEDIECLQAGNQICEMGLPFVQIGDPIAMLDINEFSNATLEDTVKTMGDYVWWERTIHLPQGAIIIDGEYFDKQTATDSMLNDSFIIRVRVESPLFHTSQNISVGSKIDQLTALQEDMDFSIIPIPDYEAISVVSKKSRVSYIIKDEGNKLNQSMSEFTLEKLTADAEISAIVVM